MTATTSRKVARRKIKPPDLAKRKRGATMRTDVDLEACPCVDGGHWWDKRNAVYHVKQRGALRGMAVRTLVCQRCDSSKDQPLTWDGRIAGASVYDYTDTYIENARLLGDHHERANHMREVDLQRAREHMVEELEAQSA